LLTIVFAFNSAINVIALFASFADAKARLAAFKSRDSEEYQVEIVMSELRWKQLCVSCWNDWFHIFLDGYTQVRNQRGAQGVKTPGLFFAPPGKIGWTQLKKLSLPL